MKSSELQFYFSYILESAVTIKKLMFMCWLANMTVFRVHQHTHCGLKSYTVVLMFCPDVPFSSCLMINVHSF